MFGGALRERRAAGKYFACARVSFTVCVYVCVWVLVFVQYVSILICISICLYTCLRHTVTNRKVAGSVPYDVIELSSLT